MNRNPFSCSFFTFDRTMGFSHIFVFIEGTSRTGTVVAMTIVVRKSSAMPPAIFPRILAVAGAMTTRSAMSESAMWPTLLSVKGPNISCVTGLPDSVWKVRGVTNSVAFFVMTTWTSAPSLHSDRTSSATL